MIHDRSAYGRGHRYGDGVLTPPADLDDDALVEALADGWGLAVATLTYRPVGWGSHHWEVAGDGERFFATVDDLEIRRHARAESLDTAYERLRGALAAARDLRDHGREFVVAPIGEPTVRLGDRYALALYPHVDGRSFGWGEYAVPGQRRAILDLVVSVHTAPRAARRRAPVDDFTVPHRDEVEAALRGDDPTADPGPYARPVAALIADNAAPIRRLLDRYDELVATAKRAPERVVLTHGEPHAANTMLTDKGNWRLIDWETARVAPLERDLWHLDPGDGEILDAYADATGVRPVAAMLDLYRLRWGLADLAVDVRRFRRPHRGTPEDDKSWELLRNVVQHLAGQPGDGLQAPA
jgi:spectinomycin phosphotransferase/16S rRNA (guanine(1405)-N(7))-methyltransferase